MFTVEARSFMAHRGEDSWSKKAVENRVREPPSRKRRSGRRARSPALVCAGCMGTAFIPAATREPHEHCFILGPEWTAGFAVLLPASAVGVKRGATKSGRKIFYRLPLRIGDRAEREKRIFVMHFTIHSESMTTRNL